MNTPSMRYEFQRQELREARRQDMIDRWLRRLALLTQAIGFVGLGLVASYHWPAISLWEAYGVAATGFTAAATVWLVQQHREGSAP